MTHEMDRVRVDLGVRSYDVIIGSGLVSQAGRHLVPLLQKPRVAVITDENVGALYASPLTRSFREAGIDCLACTAVPPGEASKSIALMEKLACQLLAAGVDRQTTLIALGGGVVGDLAGFLAATLLRGVDFVQLPTTLLAQVDSSVGGKTGVNLPAGKNLLGAFWQPRAVLADVASLATLPRRELLAGYAETVKYGLINDAAFFDWLEKHGRDLLDGDGPALRHAVATSIAAKAAIVGRDERETAGGPRALLNLGHSFGHALEALAGYNGSLLHGEAVAIGMVMAFEFSARRGFCPDAEAARVRRHLAAAGLPVDLPAGVLPGAMLAAMRHDKKAEAGRIRLVLARGIGQAFMGEPDDNGDILAFIADAKRKG